ncbi:MAG: histidinol dehydrogenase [Oscillospiraceae bacterium]|jgi:histidinol dehydrogenase|nr:histidinol dehydrogenase [Oscillospiraceae bacterium]
MIKTYKYGEFELDELRSGETAETDISADVAAIIADVRKRGDAALYDYTRRFDKVELSALEVTREELDAAVARCEPEFLAILKRAAANIEAFHKNQVRTGFVAQSSGGVFMGQKITPIERVGLYIPGGTAAYPSSALMNAIPAKLAGVSELIMVTPPAKDGNVNPDILAAARVAGVDRVFKLGGAHAVAALAYGTESVPRVDKITGPGNAFVAEAKRQVYGIVGIDMIAGPSDVLVIADDTANPVLVAADMLAQAEHDANATAVLVTDSAELAAAVGAEVERQLKLLPRGEIAGKSIERNGKLVVAPSIAAAVELANALAPEHLELCVASPFDLLDSVRNAGSVFLGHNTPEALGDYLAGPNHTLPTLGTARFSSPLSVDDFTKKTQFTYFSESALRDAGRDVVAFAEREGLEAHARSVSLRLNSAESGGAE